MAKLYARLMALTCLTGGLYWPTAQQQWRAYVWPRLRLGDEPLAWTGDAATQMSLATGRFVMVLWAINGLYMVYSSLNWGISAAPFAALPFVLGQLLALWVRALVQLYSYRYQLQHTRWRGTAFALEVQPYAYARLYLYNALLCCCTLGLTYGVFAVRTRRMLIGSIRWGAVQASYTAEEKAATKLYVLGALASLISLGAYLPWHIAKLRGFHAQHTGLGPLTLQVTQEGSGLSNLWLKNCIISICSLGFATGFARSNALRYQMGHLRVTGPVDTLLSGATRDEEPAGSDGLVDAVAFGQYGGFGA